MASLSPQAVNVMGALDAIEFNLYLMEAQVKGDPSISEHALASTLLLSDIGAIRDECARIRIAVSPDLHLVKRETDAAS